MESKTKDFVQLDVSTSIWSRFFTIAPLVIIGTKEEKGYDMAPKHLAMPMGFNNYFGFVCTPRHSTYHNVLEHKEFSVSFPLSNQVVLASISASPRNKYISKSEQIIHVLPTIKANTIDALLVKDSYVYLECKLFKIIDGFDDNSMIAGKICAAAVHPDYIKVSEKDEQEQLSKHPLLAYLADGRFATISETFNFPFPKNFTR
ncbi:flavin reductase [Aquimarina sp. MMG016]|uniref:flavin reductase family protein n=1 Tax=Aquimarina sp. MMG016 TaxID=2822690 RepID=UPI001B3A2CD5|nr:flavin reductase [Aquimarina sp. MMG016]MBQ4819677.1 flavin reductase [Aquimarina sp. MMG016]